MKIFKPNTIADYIGAIFVMVSFFAGVVGFWYITRQPAPSSIPPAERPVVSCPPDLLSYQQAREKQGKILPLIDSRQQMFVEDGKFVNEKVVLTQSDTNKSKVACGYLFVQAGSKKGALHSYEDVIVDPNNFGGHLNPSSAVSVNENDQFSQYLYSLNKIEYWPTRDRRVVYTADWASVFNAQAEIPLHIALNMNDKSGFIDEVSIVYKCWNPTTGEEADDCELKVSSREQTYTDTVD